MTAIPAAPARPPAQRRKLPRDGDPERTPLWGCPTGVIGAVSALLARRRILLPQDGLDIQVGFLNGASVPKEHRPRAIADSNERVVRNARLLNFPAPQGARRRANSTGVCVSNSDCGFSMKTPVVASTARSSRRD